MQSPPERPAPRPAVAAATGQGLPTALRIVAALLIAQSIVRVGFLGYTLSLAKPELLFANPSFFARGILLPAILATLAIIAGILLLRRSPVARTFGLVACLICLLVQLFFTATGFGVYFSTATLPALTVFSILVLGPIYIGIFVAGLVCLSRWRPAPG
jgi:hypothetical protein